MTQVIDFIGGEYRNRTGVHGFAIRCVTTPPTRQPMDGALLSDHIFTCKSPRTGKMGPQPLPRRKRCGTPIPRESEQMSLANERFRRPPYHDG